MLRESEASEIECSGRTNAGMSFNLGAFPAAVNNSLLEDKKSEFPDVFGHSGPTVEDQFYGW